MFSFRTTTQLPIEETRARVARALNAESFGILDREAALGIARSVQIAPIAA